MQDIAEKLEQRGVKPTAMRLMVYRALEKAHYPLSLKELEELLVTAERSTIFRTLTLLLQHHLVHGIEDGGGTMKYELCHGHDHCTLDDQHTHFYCVRCHRTFCLRHTPIPQVELPQGFCMTTINYMIKGLCPKCSLTQPSP